MEKDELLVKRIQELAGLAERRGCVMFTDFLDLNEQNIWNQTLQKFSWIHGETFGGYEGAERRMAALLPPDGPYDELETVYPISCIRIAPVNLKFAEKLSHRDILGALMSLGIERSRTGDIAMGLEESYLFCHDTLAELICRELISIRRTNVRCAICSPADFSYEPETEPVTGTVASVRLDAIMALAFHSSRSSLLALISQGKVFVNGRLVTSNACSLKEQDLVSVRGMGKFRYIGVTGQTKKGRMAAHIERYV